MASAKEKIVEDVEESRSFMKMINRKGEITEPSGTPQLIEWKLERYPLLLLQLTCPIES